MEKPFEAVRSSGRRHPVATWLIRALFAILLIPVVVASFLYTQQHKMIYHPRPYQPHELQGLSSSTVELEFITGASRQSALYMSPRGIGQLPDRLWIAFCGNGSVALDWRYFVQDYPNASDAFLLIDYPGYGKSQGYATIESTRAAADQALSALAKTLRVDESQLEPRLNAIGHSLGAAAALDFATRHPVQRIVAFAPFTSLREEAATVFGGLLSRLVVENYDNRARLKELARHSPGVRVAIVHGSDDAIIPFRMGQMLAAEFPGLVQFFPVENGDHVSVIELSRKQVIDWMAR